MRTYGAERHSHELLVLEPTYALARKNPPSRCGAARGRRPRQRTGYGNGEKRSYGTSRGIVGRSRRTVCRLSQRSRLWRLSAKFRCDNREHKAQGEPHFKCSCRHRLLSSLVGGSIGAFDVGVHIPGASVGARIPKDVHNRHTSYPALSRWIWKLSGSASATGYIREGYCFYRVTKNGQFGIAGETDNFPLGDADSLLFLAWAALASCGQNVTAVDFIM